MESNGKGGFIDRSKVRILLCDNDIKSSQEVFTLLLKCSYQVTSVRSARQVIDALNAEGPDIDIILAEVDLPMSKGIKMLKYVTRDKELRRIPVIMMSAQDEVSTVVKCLRLGAADYLLKPLRTNELLNLWTHMWRRRRMIGLGAKNILYYDVDPVASDPSDANTNSTTLFSDGTDDKSLRSTNVEKEITVQREDAPLATFAVAAGTEQHRKLDIPGTSNHQKEQLSCGPKKTELKIGVSSAFFTYKSSSVKEMHNQEVARNETAENIRMVEKIQVQLSDAPLQVSHNGTAENIRMVENIQVQISDAPLHERAEAWESQSQSDDPRSSSSILDSLSLERSSTPPASVEFRRRHFGECQHNGSGLSTPSVYQYFTSGIRNQLIMPAPAQLCEKSLQELRNHTAAALMNQYNQIPQFPHQMTGMTPYSHYPAGICSQPGQVSIPHSWPSPAGEQANKVADRREAALIKFRQKRKERCFDKKIRYVNRKKLAEKRPRVRGQFVRKVNGINVDLNGHPASINYDEDDDEQATSDSTQGHNITGS